MNLSAQKTRRERPSATTKPNVMHAFSFCQLSRDASESLGSATATDARIQSLKIGPLPPLIHAGSVSPPLIPGHLNLQIKHWATLLKVLLLTDLCGLYH